MFKVFSICFVKSGVISSMMKECLKSVFG